MRSPASFESTQASVGMRKAKRRVLQQMEFRVVRGCEGPAYGDSRSASPQ